MLTVVDLGVGNLASLSSALRFLGADFEVSAEVDTIVAARAIVLPGVGAFDTAITRLDDLGLREPLIRRIAAGVPTLGICLGMQLLYASSEEGTLPGLGVFPERVERLGRIASSKVPHVGFDTVRADPGTWLERALGPTPDFYFTQSYAVVKASTSTAVGWCDYDDGIVGAVEQWPVVGAQFHPEKSQASGLGFLASFMIRAVGLP